MKKRMFIFLFAMFAVFSCSIIAQADATPTRDQAVQWLYSQNNAYYDLDGKYGAQCSDFVTAYMNWLYSGNTNPNQGYAVYNANYYPTAAGWNTDRWTVIKNYLEFIPEPGDIFVSVGTANYGHVGVVLEASDNLYATVIDQNSVNPNETTGHSAYIHTIKWTGAYSPTYYIRYNHFAQPHTHNYSKTVTKPTCTQKGYTTYTCSCGSSYVSDEVAALGHNYKSTVTAPTCTKKGYTTHTCSRCGDSYTDSSTSALGHNYVKGVCTRCGAKDPKAPENRPFVFADVKDQSAYYYDPVYWAYDHKPQITNGIDATHFGPERGCTRAQVVTFLWRAAGCPEPTRHDTGFADVSADAYYVKAVLWAIENGITNGTGSGLFSPDASATRAQIVTFLWRANGSPKASGKTAFEDVVAGSYYETPVRWAVKEGITTGTGKTSFSPESTCTRGQIVTFLYRAMEG